MQVLWNVKLINKPKPNLSIYRRIIDDYICQKKHTFIRCHYQRMDPLVITDGVILQ